MFIFKRVPHLRDWISKRKKMNSTIGFVPTMGALHEGHISLVHASMDQCDHTIVSIFVNPLQFNDAQDLKKYPRPIEDDIHLIHDTGAEVLFLPEAEEVYPPDDPIHLHFDPGPLGEVMEGKFRPGHFEGVAEVVYRLLKFIEPDDLFLGQKDFQQVAIIRKLIADQALQVRVVVCPTWREANGLAMSSRNLRLSDQAREDAGLIYDQLCKGKIAYNSGVAPKEIQETAIHAFQHVRMVPEYFEIADGHTLQPIEDQKASPYVVACCAVKVEGIRLIDNLIYREP